MHNRLDLSYHKVCLMKFTGFDLSLMVDALDNAYWWENVISYYEF